MVDYYLRQGTAETVKIGPFLKSDDGITEMSSLSLTDDMVYLSKDHGAFAPKNETTNPTYDACGYYDCPLNATDTATVGSLIIYCHDASAVPVRMYCEVLPANVFDAGRGTDLLDVNTAQLGGTAQTANDVGADVEEILHTGGGLTFIEDNIAYDPTTGAITGSRKRFYPTPADADAGTNLKATQTLAGSYDSEDNLEEFTGDKS